MSKKYASWSAVRRALALCLGALLFLPLCATVQAAPMAPVDTAQAAGPGNWMTDTLRHAQQEKKVSVALKGDGSTTTSVQILITNNSDTPLRLVIPKYECFHPGIPGMQVMMCMQDCVALVPPNKVIDFRIITYCVSTKDIPPPPNTIREQNPPYMTGPYGDPKMWERLVSIIQLADQLEKSGAYAKCPRTANLQKSLIQLSLWQRLGLASNDPDKLESAKSIEDDFLKQFGEAADKDPKVALEVRAQGFEPVPQEEFVQQLAKIAKKDPLFNEKLKRIDFTVPSGMSLTETISYMFQKAHEESPEKGKPSLNDKFKMIGYSVIPPVRPITAQKKEMLDVSMDRMFEAVDLTVRRSDESVALEAAKKILPRTQWDSFAQVGSRAYSDGEFIEAGPILEAALSESKQFGETDPRYTRSLISLGRLYTDIPGMFSVGEAKLQKAQDLTKRISGPNAVEVAEVDNDLGVVMQREQSFDRAEPFFREAADIAQKSASGTSDLVAQSLKNLGVNYTLQGAAEKATPELLKSLTIVMGTSQASGAKDMMPSETPEIAEIETDLANAYGANGELDKAKQLLEKANSTCQKCLGDEHAYVAKIADDLADVATKLSDPDADKYKRAAQNIREKALGKLDESRPESKALYGFVALPNSYDSLDRLQKFCKLQGQVSKAKSNLLMHGEEFSAGPVVEETTKSSKPIRDKWAVVIGVSNFKDPSINLKYPAKDAKDFADFLTKEANFPADHVHVLLNENASREKIMSEIGGKFLPRANEDDLVVIYISSHGSPSQVDTAGANYLVAYNTDKNDLYATGIEMKELTRQLSQRVRCNRVVLLLDACHSGAVNPYVDAAKGLFRNNNFDAVSVAQGTGQLVICSSDPTQISWESKRYQNGVFTHHLVDAFRKSGAKIDDAFKNMQKGVADEVREDRGESQVPQLKSKWSGAQLVLATPPTVKTSAPLETLTNASDDSKKAATGAAKSIGGKGTGKPANVLKAPGKPPTKSPAATTH